MTSTNVNVGLIDRNRNSSRILKPPGGGHTNIFGNDDDTVQKNRPKAYPQQKTGVSELFSCEDNNKNKPTPRKPSTCPFGLDTDINDENKPVAYKPLPSMPGMDANGGENVVKNTENVPSAPTDIVDVADEKIKVERKRVPPGGYSQRLW